MNEDPNDTKRRQVTDDMIQQRAHQISEGQDAGTAEENWEKAERELRAQEEAADA